MKHLNPIETQASDPGDVLPVNANHSQPLDDSDRDIIDAPVETDVSALQRQVKELQGLARRLGRPALTDEQREQTVTAIMRGLSGFGKEVAAKMASTTYNKAWFDAEPDHLLRHLLGQELLAKYGASPMANVTLWTAQ